MRPIWYALPTELHIRKSVCDAAAQNQQHVHTRQTLYGGRGVWVLPTYFYPSTLCGVFLADVFVWPSCHLNELHVLGSRAHDTLDALGSWARDSQLV